MKRPLWWFMIKFHGKSFLQNFITSHNLIHALGGVFRMEMGSNLLGPDVVENTSITPYFNNNVIC